MQRFDIFAGFVTVFIAVMVIFFPAKSIHAEGRGLKKAVFIRPDSDDQFWNLMETVMQAAAHDLGVTLDVHHINEDHFRMVQKARQIVDSADKPDVVFLEALGSSDFKAIKIFDDAGIDVFTLNTKPDPKFGKPREKYKHWIGQMNPDDHLAGRMIAERLYAAARSKSKDSTEKIEMVAIQGSPRVSPSDTRLAGLYDVMEKYDRLDLRKVVEGYWSEEPSQKAASALLKQYPDLDIIWAVNDSTAIGAVKAIEASGLKAGKDVMVAGIDWLPETFPYIEDGRITASLGGHFMESAWALILAYDYKNGHDFAGTAGTEIASSMEIIDGSNIKKYGEKLSAMDWESVDFRGFTKMHNPALQSYDFNVLDALDQTS